MEYYVIKNTDIYVVLLDDYDCKPFVDNNYLYGLSMRNLYFEGKIINYNCVNSSSGGGKIDPNIPKSCVRTSYTSTSTSNRSYSECIDICSGL